MAQISPSVKEMEGEVQTKGHNRNSLQANSGVSMSPSELGTGVDKHGSPRTNVGSQLRPIGRKDAEEAARKTAVMFGGNASGTYPAHSQDPRRPSLMRKLSQGISRGISKRALTAGFNRSGFRTTEDEGWGVPTNGPGGRYSMSRRMSQALFHDSKNFENLQLTSHVVFSEYIEFRWEVFIPMLVYHVLEPISLPFVMYAEGNLLTKNLGMLPTRTRWLAYTSSRVVLYGFVVLPIVLWVVWDMADQVGYMSLCITLILYLIHKTTVAMKYAYMSDTQYRDISTKKMLTGEEAESYSLLGWLKQGADTVEREMIGSFTRLKLHSVGGLYFAFLPHQKFKVCKVCLIDDSPEDSNPALMSAFVMRSGAPEAAKNERRKSRMFDSPNYTQKVRRKSRQSMQQMSVEDIMKNSSFSGSNPELKEEEQPLIEGQRKPRDDGVSHPAPILEEDESTGCSPKKTSIQLKSPVKDATKSNLVFPAPSEKQKEFTRRNTPDIPGKVKNKSEEIDEQAAKNPRPRTSNRDTETMVNTAAVLKDEKSVSSDTEPDNDSTSRLLESNNKLEPVERSSENSVKVSPLPSPSGAGSKSRPGTSQGFDARPGTGTGTTGRPASRGPLTTARSQPVHVTVEDSRVAGAQEPLLCLNLEQIIRTLINRQEAKTPWKTLQSLALCLAWIQAMLIPAIRAVVITDDMAYIPLILFALGQVSLRYNLLMYMISTYYDLHRRDWILSHVGKIMDSGLLVDSPQPQAENIYMWLAMRRIVTEFGQPFQKRVMVFTSLLMIFAWVCLVWLILLNLLILRDDGFYINGLNFESIIVIFLDSFVIYGGLFFITMMGSKVNTKDVRHCAAINRQTTRVQMRILNWHPNMSRARSLLHKMEVLERVLKGVAAAVSAEGEYYKIKVLGMITSETIYLGILVLWGLTIAMALAISI